MGYSVLQTSLDIPSVEALKRAFRAVKCLTDYDAHTMAADAFGILVKNMSPQDAADLQGALRVEKIETEIVDDSTLPVLPPSKMVQRLDCLSEGLKVYDPLGRSFGIDWGHVMLVAAGRVKLTAFNRIEKQVPKTQYTGEGFSYTTMESEYGTREERTYQPVMEVILHRNVMRYAVHAEKFNFAYLAERKSQAVDQNFGLLVQDMCRFAPSAAVNRGAYYIREGDHDHFSYPTRNAYYEEITWLIWRCNRDQAPLS